MGTDEAWCRTMTGGHEFDDGMCKSATWYLLLATFDDSLCYGDHFLKTTFCRREHGRRTAQQRPDPCKSTRYPLQEARIIRDPIWKEDMIALSCLRDCLLSAGWS